jgi:Xaa-Pro aminopeptidase
MYEYEVEAEIEYAFRKGGAEDLAYPSIVAGGDNACILHYNSNREKLTDGSLLLIDAGGEMGLYASDITRTFPVNGKFTPAQKTIYELVLKAQKEAIAVIKPGLPFHDVHKRAVEVLVEGLLQLGFLQGKKEEIVKDKAKYAAYFPHGTSHWLGLDVHDAGIYFKADNSSYILEEGNVLTVEPGLYISPENKSVPVEYRGIGIRIEDDVLVTSSGSDVLTKDCPKEVSELERIIGSKVN